MTLDPPTLRGGELAAPVVAIDVADAPARADRSSFGPQWAIIGIFVLLLLGALTFARSFLMPVVLALLLQLVFSPLRRSMERIGLSAGLSAGLILFALVGSLVFGAALLAVPVSNWIDRAPTITQELSTKLEEIRGATETVQAAAEEIDRLAQGGDDSEAEPVRVEAPSTAFSVVVSVPGILAQVVLTLVLLFFLLASGDMFYEKIVHVMPTFADKRRAMRVAFGIERKLSRYFFVITLINFGLGVAVGGAMYLLGMPNPALIGVAAMLLNFVPYIGALIGMVGAIVIAIVSLDTVNQALIVGAVYFVLTGIEGQLVTPTLVGRSLRLNPVVVFVSVALFAWLWSVVGMLVATPLLVAARTICEQVPGLQGFGHFLSSRGEEGKPGSDET